MCWVICLHKTKTLTKSKNFLGAYTFKRTFQTIEASSSVLYAYFELLIAQFKTAIISFKGIYGTLLFESFADISFRMNII